MKISEQGTVNGHNEKKYKEKQRISLMPIEQSYREDASSGHKKRKNSAQSRLSRAGSGDGNGSAQYFVANNFVDKIFDDISRKQDRNKDVILSQIQQMEEKVVAVMNIKLVDMPIVEEKFDLNTRRTIFFGKQIINDRSENKLNILKKNIWIALTRNVASCKRNNRLTS